MTLFFQDKFITNEHEQADILLTEKSVFVKRNTAKATTGSRL